jgi:hypothetical protein
MDEQWQWISERWDRARQLSRECPHESCEPHCDSPVCPWWHCVRCDSVGML